ncbi:MAG: hypothetical protein JSR44_09990 [Spirochaetes bacterium]|nr:hypothetical protein [Spirochaetota bacterium]
MEVVKVIHLLKRVEQIDREINELHGLVDGIDSSRSYRNTMKIAAEKQINDLIGERVKLMELKIDTPPDFLKNQVYPLEKQASTQPKIALEALLGATHSTYTTPTREVDESSATAALKNFTRMMSVDEILPKASIDNGARVRRADKPAVKSRAEILRDLPPLQY